MAQHEWEPPAVRRPSGALPKHTIFLSHSGQEKAFVEQLCEDLKRMNYSPFFDQESDSLPKGERFASLILQAAEECWLAVVVVSKGYLTSKWPMLELRAFVKARKTKNPKLKLMPVFYKLSPGDFDAEKVKTEWVKSWNVLVAEGKVRAEEVALWSEAVRELRGLNGVEFSKYGISEVKFRAAVVDEICKCVSPVMKYNTDRVRGYKRMCEMLSSMFEEGTCEEDICKQGQLYLGLYGMGGLGKTTLCGAMCSYFQAEFRGRVCHVELLSDGESERIGRLKHAIRQLSGFDSRIVDMITSESQGLECLKSRLRDQPPVFIALDNVGDSQSSQEEARAYLEAGVACGSKVMVTCRSGMILKGILGDGKYCKAIPRLDALEAQELFLSVAAPRKLLCALQPAEDEIVKAYLRECEFVEDGCSRKQYHPLVLRAVGSFCHDVDEDNIMSWNEGLVEGGVLQKSSESKRVNDILGLNYYKLPEICKSIFLDLALLFERRFRYGLRLVRISRGWWEEGTSFEWEYSFITKLHGMSPFDAKMKVKELQRKSLIYETGASLSMHDLYVEFTHMLVKKEGSKESKWWLHSNDMAGGDNIGLKRLLVDRHDQREILRNPEQMWEHHSLECLMMVHCDFRGNHSLDLGSLKSLRVLVLHGCKGIVEIGCDCGKGSNGLPCYERKGVDERCLRQLRIVNFNWRSTNVTSVVRYPFLRHCLHLQCLTILPPSEYILGESELLNNLKALEVLCLRFRQWGFGDIPEDFVGKLLSGVAILKNLKILEIVFPERFFGEVRQFQESGTIDLSPLGVLTSLSTLSLYRLPKYIVELKGLEQLSKLTTLRLCHCEGLREVKGLDQLSQLSMVDLACCEKLCKLPNLPPSLTHICFHDCFNLEDPNIQPPAERLRGIKFEVSNYFYSHRNHENCFKQRCNRLHCYQCVTHHKDHGCHESEESCKICRHLLENPSGTIGLSFLLYEK